MKSYKLVPVDVKPEKEGVYFIIEVTGAKRAGYFEGGKWNIECVTHYLLPVSEEEHREEMREVWMSGYDYGIVEERSSGWSKIKTPDFDTFYNNKYKPE
jgi:hypothetical protein